MKASVLIAVVLMSMPPGHAADRILIQVPAAMDSQVTLSDVIKRECPVAMLLGNQVFRMVSVKFPRSLQIEMPDGTEKAHVLALTILRVVAAEGGTRSGPKSLTVRADLMQSGKVLATMVKERDSEFTPRWGTCALLERVAALIGQDIATWLPGALSGDVSRDAR